MGRIRVVEDNPNNLDLMSLMLHASGQTVTPAVTGSEGFRRAADGAPDPVVLDIQLPDATGQQVLGWLRADDCTAALPVVAVTAYAMVGERERARPDGFDGDVCKPIVPATFARLLDQYLPVAIRGHEPRRFGDQPAADPGTSP